MNTTSRTHSNISIAALFTALVMTIAVNGSTLALFDNLAQLAQTGASSTTVALDTVTVTAKRI